MKVRPFNRAFKIIHYVENMTMRVKEKLGNHVKAQKNHD